MGSSKGDINLLTHKSPGLQWISSDPLLPTPFHSSLAPLHPNVPQQPQTGVVEQTSPATCSPKKFSQEGHQQSSALHQQAICNSRSVFLFPPPSHLFRHQLQLLINMCTSVPVLKFIQLETGWFMSLRKHLRISVCTPEVFTVSSSNTFEENNIFPLHLTPELNLVMHYSFCIFQGCLSSCREHSVTTVGYLPERKCDFTTSHPPLRTTATVPSNFQTKNGLQTDFE